MGNYCRDDTKRGRSGKVVRLDRISAQRNPNLIKTERPRATQHACIQALTRLVELAAKEQVGGLDGAEIIEQTAIANYLMNRDEEFNIRDTMQRIFAQVDSSLDPFCYNIP